MNHLILSLSAVVLGATIGIGVHHAMTHGDISTLNSQSTAPIIIQAHPGYMQTTDGELYPSSSPSIGMQAPQNSPQDINALKKRLDLLARQQTGLKGEQNELNREINAIQFRLDSHSASFRPLQSENGDSTESDNAIPIPDSENPLILPPR